MPKRILVFCLILLAAGAAYHFRERAAMGLYNALSPDDGWEIAVLEGLWARPAAAGAERLVLEDGASGRRIQVSGLHVERPFRAVLAGRPLALVSASRVEVGPALRPVEQAPPEIRMDDWLAQLRTPLFTALKVDALVLPPWPLPLSVHADWGGGGLEVVLEGAPWRVEGTLHSPAGGRAEARLSFLRNAHRQLRAELSLAAEGAGYRLDVIGGLDAPRIEELPMPLGSLADRLTGASLDWRATVRMPHDPFELAPDDIRLTLAEGGTLQLGAGLVEGMAGPAITLDAPLELSFGGDFHSGLRIDAHSTRLRMGNLQYGEYGLSALVAIPRARIRLGGNPALDLALQASELHAEGLPDWLPAVELHGEAKLQQEEWTFQSEVRLARDDTVLMQANGAYDMSEGGRALLVLPLQTFSTDHPLSARFPRWPFLFDIAGGELEAEMSLLLDPPGATGAFRQASLRGAMRELTGYHGDIFFHGLSGPLQAELSPGAALPLSTPVLSWTLERFNAGIDLTALALDFSLRREPPALAVDAFSGRLLGGELHSDGFVYGFDASRNELEFAFQDIRLERVLDLVDQPGVEAVGGVSGTLPIVVQEGVASVEAGSFRSEPPGGVIRYTPGRPQGSAVNPGLSLVEQALSDYRFDSIDGTLDYTPAGDIDILLRIQGYNPGMSDGQRINLNLTLSDNLPVLLRSLQAGRTIQDMLESQL